MKTNKTKFIATFLLATFAIGTTISAQQNPFKLTKQNEEASNSYKKANQFLKVNQTKTHNRPTTIKQRVLSQTYFDDTNLPSDSTTFAYSGMRGSDFDYYNLDFEYNTDHESGILPEINSILYSNRMAAYADTIKEYYDNGNGEYSFSMAYYRADNQLDSIITGMGDNSSVTAYNKSENTFNATGVLQTTTWSSVGNPNDYSITNYYYNAAFTKIILDSTFYFTGGNSYLDWITSYKYDANDRIDSVITYGDQGGSNIIMADFTVLSYYPNGSLLSRSSYEMNLNNMSFQIEQSDSFSYFSNFDAYETIKIYSYDEGVLYTKIFALGTLGANGYPDSLKARVTDYDINDSFNIAIAFEYNSFNNPTNISTYFDDDYNGKTHFRYEEYDDSPASIKPIVNGSFEVFPNPIKDQININNKSELNGQYSISLMDISGRMVFERQQTISAGQNIISIPQIAKGIYLLELKNDKGIQFSQKVVKE